MTTKNQTPIEIPVWPHVYGAPESRGVVKTFPHDFIVQEQLSFQPEGTGEHVFVQIEKRGENTDYVARLLARFSGVRQRDVSYAGLKDRHAISTQWFSVWMPGKEAPDWNQLNTETIKILQAIRHQKKLKRGLLSANHFQILIRQWLGSKTKLEQQLQQIKANGFPNYFGSQRFGNQGQNVNKALMLFQGTKIKRAQRSIYLSAARSYLFNQLLAQRIKANNWNKPITGDVFIFDQSNSYFKSNQLDETLLQRVEKGEIHPTGMMFGEGKMETSAKALEFEKLIIDKNSPLAHGLVKFGLSNDRRALRVYVKNLQWEYRQDSTVFLSFSLPAGSYATSLLRELITS